MKAPLKSEGLGNLSQPLLVWPGASIPNLPARFTPKKTRRPFLTERRANAAAGRISELDENYSAAGETIAMWSSFSCLSVTGVGDCAMRSWPF